MRHAILGAGGVGLALGAALARAGHEVLLVMRESSRARYRGVIDVHSKLHGDLAVEARAVERLDEPVDVLWVTVKAPALDAALARVAPRLTPDSVVPLLNGLDHPRSLRTRFGPRQLVGAILIEAERTAPGRVTWNSLYAEVSLATTDGGRAGDGPEDRGRAGDGPERGAGTGGRRLGGLAEVLADAGLGCTPERDPASVLWRKLVLLLPLALATTAADGPLGIVRRRPELSALLRDAAREACAVAAADTVVVDDRNLLHTLDTLPGRTDTSLHRDVAAGVRPTELAALTEPVLRRARDHHVAVPALTELARRAAERERPAEVPAPHRSTYRKGETS
ncbi:ketopantoate reductase family protein [Streptomyces sp. NBC_00103]|uniref:ketopantoate reductase family protein n=1 Tax=Streptomyces sp. NBC_00103 TaxID=2975653 RepID=UPI00224ECEB8|nr:2-dehydropantoate 2-reductase [Streptomyces sp. NBC_00103]MCX5370155.1 2-dehydropantoate 2-reductase [Streptomyces sp. NBC_00103]